MKTIIIAGGSGFLGNALEDHFSQQGYSVKILTRNPKRSNEIQWDGNTLRDWANVLENAKAVINLTGKSINNRHTEETKKVILNSRVNSTKVIGDAIAQCENPPSIWVNASSAAVYEESQTPSDESSPETDQGFLEGVTHAWEKTIHEAQTPHTRKVILRITVVLGKNGGALSTLKTLTKFGMGGKQGTGKQKLSWIHLKDFVRVVEFLMTHTNLSGPFNICAPEPVSNAHFMATLRKTMGVPFGIPHPKFIIKLGAKIIGIEPDLILKSLNVVPKRLLDNGFQFEFPSLEEALKDILD